MKKKIVFWCPFISKVGTINAVMESAKALANSKKFECKIINVFGEFDDYNYIIKKNSLLHPELLDWKAISFSCIKQTGDTLLWNENLKILYASEVVFNNSIPSLSKGHTKPWVRGLEFLRALKPTHVIGSGTVSSFGDFKIKALEFNITYLNLIYEIAKKDYLLGIFRDGNNF